MRELPEPAGEDLKRVVSFLNGIGLNWENHDSNEHQSGGNMDNRDLAVTCHRGKHPAGPLETKQGIYYGHG